MSVLTTFHEGEDNFIFFTKESKEHIGSFIEEENLNCPETIVEDQDKNEIFKKQTKNKDPKTKSDLICQECGRNYNSRQSLKIHRKGVQKKLLNSALIVERL